MTYAKNLTTGEQRPPVTGVRCWVGGQTYIESGDDTGTVFECESPWATQENIDALLLQLLGFIYAPFTAEKARLDPAVEIGDSVEIYGVHSNAYSISTDFSGAMLSDVAAPENTEVDHEYLFETPQEREYKRQVSALSASIKVNADSILSEVEERTAENVLLASQIEQMADSITAKVSSSGGGSSFSWELTADKWELKSGNTTVLKATSDGIEVQGVIKATSGRIGAWSIGEGDGALRYLDGENGGLYLGSGGIIGSAGEPVGGVNQWKFVLSSSGDLICQRAILTDDGSNYSSVFSQGSTAVTGGLSGGWSASNWFAGQQAGFIGVGGKAAYLSKLTATDLVAGSVSSDWLYLAEGMTFAGRNVYIQNGYLRVQ
jgi:hypothetical protein